MPKRSANPTRANFFCSARADSETTVETFSRWPRSQPVMRVERAVASGARHCTPHTATGAGAMAEESSRTAAGGMDHAGVVQSLDERLETSRPLERDEVGGTRADVSMPEMPAEDPVKDLLTRKESELMALRSRRVSDLESRVERGATELAELRSRMHQLREDFQYNLNLLDERDRELERYDAQFARAATEAEDAARQVREARPRRRRRSPRPGAGSSARPSPRRTTRAASRRCARWWSASVSTATVAPETARGVRRAQARADAPDRRARRAAGDRAVGRARRPPRRRGEPGGRTSRSTTPTPRRPRVPRRRRSSAAWRRRAAAPPRSRRRKPRARRRRRPNAPPRRRGARPRRRSARETPSRPRCERSWRRPSRGARLSEDADAAAAAAAAAVRARRRPRTRARGRGGPAQRDAE